MAISTSPNRGLTEVSAVNDQKEQNLSPGRRLMDSLGRLSTFKQSGKITEKDRIFLFSQLALMLETGTPLNRSLVAITPQIKSPYFKEVVEDIIAQIEGGKSFSVALTKYEKDFSPITINMMKAGEISGSLETMLSQAELYEKKKAEFRAMIKRAMTYPLLLMGLSLCVIIFVLTFVFPKFADLFADVWEILPASTKILMGVSNFTLDYWYALIIGLVIVAFVSWTILTHKKVIPIIDRIKIKTPLIGNLFIMAYTSQMLRTLGFLIGGGVPLLDGLTTTRETIKNTLYRAFIDRIITSAKDGKASPMPFFRPHFSPKQSSRLSRPGKIPANSILS